MATRELDRERSSVPGRPHLAHRIVVLASEPIAGGQVAEEIARHVRDERDEVLVVAPALVESPFKLGAGEVEPAVERAQRRLSESVDHLRDAGLRAIGTIGDADPSVALGDALRLHDADEVVITMPARDDEKDWLEDELIDRARREIDEPITQIVVEPAPDGTERVKEVREVSRISAEAEAADEKADYLPPIPLRDRITLVVGIVGTILLGVLLLTPGDSPGATSFVIRFLLALGAFMFTLWHGVALLIFASVGYKGRWEKIAAETVLFGVPLAIAISIVVR